MALVVQNLEISLLERREVEVLAGGVALAHVDCIADRRGGPPALPRLRLAIDWSVLDARDRMNRRAAAVVDDDAHAYAARAIIGPHLLERWRRAIIGVPQRTRRFVRRYGAGGRWCACGVVALGFVRARCRLARAV